MKTVEWLTICSIFLTGCGGRQANPIESHQPGDNEMACEHIRQEIAFLQQQFDDKRKEHQDKEAADVALAIGCVLVLVPFFFMDLKDAEKVEYQAIHASIQRLQALSNSKGCP